MLFLFLIKKWYGNQDLLQLKMIPLVELMVKDKYVTDQCYLFYFGTQEALNQTKHNCIS